MPSNEASRLSAISPVAAGGLVRAIIETPRGSHLKYKFDTDLGLFKLSRILPDGLHFPCNFGFIPGTAGEDGDALDIALLGDAPMAVGCLVTVRLLGVLRAEQIEGAKIIRNDRLVGVPVTPVNKPPQRHLGDVSKGQIDALEQFFVTYNQLQGRRFRPRGRAGAAAAGNALRRGIELRHVLQRRAK